MLSNNATSAKLNAANTQAMLNTEAKQAKQDALAVEAAQLTHAVEAAHAMQAKQSAAKNAAMLKDLVDAILENEEAFENMAFADAVDALEAELSGYDLLGTRAI